MIFFFGENLEIKIKNFLLDKLLYFGATSLDSVLGDKNCNRKEKEN